MDKHPDGGGALGQYYGPIAARQAVLQCCMDYSGLPDVRTLDMAQIRCFYEGLAPALIKAIKG